ncbi:MAG: 50S ribosomal protein L10 [Candidatus Shikimatogenerans bostrichidophilus]|nr:MAG: 50S ribosomal protein L10 [Candidatus Shikimatogenerans bostrichidophilus]
MNKKKSLDNINKLFNKYNNIYFIDISKFNSNYLFNFKKDCYKYNIKLVNIKNNILKKYFIKKEKKKFIKKINPILINSTSLMFVNNNINSPAIIIKKNKKKIYNTYYPIFKGAYINNIFYIGKKKLNILLNIKTKEEVIIELTNSLKKLIKIGILNIININKINNIINLLKKK